MTKIALPAKIQDSAGRSPALGTIGRLAIFAWSLALIFFMPAERAFLVASLPLLVNGLLYPPAVKRLFRWRWLLFAVLLLLPSIFWVGQADQLLFGRVAISSSGLAAGLSMLLRALVVILAVDGFSSAVDITEVAGLLERAGLPGLGFSLGVAVNLLPAMRSSGQNVWRSLRMRGGFRRQWWRGMQLLLVAIVVNALRRAQEIALAAEVRGFSPERSVPLPIKVGRRDWLITIFLIISFFAVLLLAR